MCELARKQTATWLVLRFAGLVLNRVDLALELAQAFASIDRSLVLSIRSIGKTERRTAWKIQSRRVVGSKENAYGTEWVLAWRDPCEGR